MENQWKKKTGKLMKRSGNTHIKKKMENREKKIRNNKEHALGKISGYHCTH